MTKTVNAGAILGVNAANGLAQSFMNGTPNVKAANPDVSFADTLSQTTTGSAPKTDNVKDPAMTKTMVSNQPNKNVKEDLNSTKDVSSLDESQVKELADSTANKAEQVFDKMKEVLDVSDEDLKEAMEVLGLTMMDLLDSANLQNLVMEVTGTEDTVSLLTDVDLYAQVKEITGFADEMLTELSNETGIDEAGLIDFIKNDNSFADVLAAANVNTDVSAEEIPVETKQTEVSDNIAVKDTADTEVKSIDDSVRVAVNTDKAEKAEDTKDTVNTGIPAEEVQADTVKTETVKVEVNSQKSNSGRQNDHLSQNGEHAVVQTPVAPVVNPTVENIVNTIESYTNEQAQDIFRQLTDFVKVNITSESTSMEMQLHPASLGTVNMQINSANGQITAHLTVQNELVKAVLESQLIQLQETFAEAGTKVEAIEVTVANYNLDSAMSGNTDNSEGEGSTGSGRSRSRRNINLNSEGAFDDMTDEEKLRAQVMDMNGNSVDFTA